MADYEYEFERLELNAGSYSLFGGVGIHADGHREIIGRRAQEGWRYVGFIPTRQRGPNCGERNILLNPISPRPHR